MGPTGILKQGMQYALRAKETKLVAMAERNPTGFLAAGVVLIKAISCGQGRA